MSLLVSVLYHLTIRQSASNKIYDPGDELAAAGSKAMDKIKKLCYNYFKEFDKIYKIIGLVAKPVNAR